MTKRQRFERFPVVSTDKDIVVSADGADLAYGLNATSGGGIFIDGYDVSVDNSQSTGEARGVRAVGTNPVSSAVSSIDMTGDLFVTGVAGTFGVHADYANAYITLVGDIKLILTTSLLNKPSYGANAEGGAQVSLKGDVEVSGDATYGVRASEEGSRLDLTGNINASSTNGARGVGTSSGATVTVNGDIAISGINAVGVTANSSDVTVTGNITMTGDNSNVVTATNNAAVEVTGDLTASGALSNGVYANSADVTVNGSVTVEGTDSYGLNGTNGGTINMNDGTLTVTDESSAGIKVENGAVATLSNVTTDLETLLVTTTTGTLTATDGSELTGDILHGGFGGTSGTLEVNLTDSTLEGAILVADGLGSLEGGVIDVTLENSDWLVTGDSNTNGTLTGIGDSTVDTSNAPEGTTVVVDEIVGPIDFNLKPGDTLGVTNTDGNNTFSSSDPDVLEVVQNEDGSWSIISKGEGDAELTYTYKDPVSGATMTTTTGVSSEYADGQSKPDTETPTGTSGSHGSSGCNAGFGIFALLGLAFVAKKK